MNIVENPSPSTLATLEGETFHAPEGAVIIRPLDVPTSVVLTPKGSKIGLHPFGVITSVGRGSLIEAACESPQHPEHADYMHHFRDVINATRVPVPHKVGDVVGFAGQLYEFVEASEGPRFLLPFGQIVTTVDPARLAALKSRLAGGVVQATPADTLRIAGSGPKGN